MFLTTIDIFNTFIQSILLSGLVFYFLCKDRLLDSKEDRMYFYIHFISLFLIIIGTTKFIGYTIAAPLVMDLLCIFVTGIIYKKYLSKAISSFIIIYLTILLSVNISKPLYFFIMNLLDLEIQVNTPIIMYLISFLAEFIIYKFRDKFYKLYKYSTNKSFGMEVLVLLLLVLEFILSVSMVINVFNEITIYKNIITLLLLILVFLFFIYLNKLHNEINRNNILLEEYNKKNKELSKIKHDYGAQISYLNGLCVMEQYDRLKVYLKRIIDGNEVDTSVKYFSNPGSIFSNIVNSTDLGDIHVVIEEEVSAYDFEIQEYDLSKIISNILRNAVTAMNGKGMIFIKTYSIFGNKYINIKNNGPKIDDSIINKIFEEGFSTKEKSDDNGFGLAITKQLVENNNGTISVYSDNEYTEFKIVFKK